MEERSEHTLRFADGATLALGRVTRVMGVLNATPDSFSDGGRFLEPDAALACAARMVDDGADLIDVGGESTRPGARPVEAAEEADRVIPVIEAVRREFAVRISIDTSKASVARQAIDAGADLVNDVSAMRDPAMLPLAAERGVPVVLMHMRGGPRTMQHDTSYDDVIATVAGFLKDRAAIAIAGGLPGDKIVVDPGIGFGKAPSGSLAILAELPRLRCVGRPILVGASRKSFIGAAVDLPLDERLEAGLAVAAYASAQGAHLIRTHDVRATRRAVRMIDAIRNSGTTTGALASQPVEAVE
jgi:dihydropteroate synthase